MWHFKIMFFNIFNFVSLSVSFVSFVVKLFFTTKDTKEFTK